MRDRLPAAAALAALIAAAGIAGFMLSARLPTRSPSSSVPPVVQTPVTGSCRIAPSSETHLSSTSPASVPSRPLSEGLDSVVDDPATRQVLLFGSLNEDSTWLWGGTRWILARPARSPSPRFYPAAAYNPLSRQVMLYGGRLANGDAACDTWAWTGSTWVELNNGNSQLPAGELAAMAWDASRQEMFLVTHEVSGLATWVWRDGWVSQSQGALSGLWASGVVYDSASRSLLMVASGSPPSNAATWRWDGTRWVPLAGHTPTTWLGSMALDPSTDQALLFPEPGDSGTPGTLWRWDASDWTPVPQSTQPSVGASEIVTTGEHGDLLLVGSLASVQSAPQALHVWMWLRRGWQLVG